MSIPWTVLLAVILCAFSGCASTGERGEAEAAGLESSVSPFLMFQDGNAEEAMGFYVEAFGGSGLGAKIVSVERYGAGEAGAEGSVKLGVFEVNGLEVKCTDSPPVHAFGFTPSVSLFVDCASEAEMDALVARLGDGGEFLMPVDDYGFSRKFGWFNDRYGVSWQVNLGYE